LKEKVTGLGIISKNVAGITFLPKELSKLTGGNIILLGTFVNRSEGKKQNA
jgi:hypothetical protein